MNEVEPMPCLDLAGGELRVRHWPANCSPPAGLRQVATAPSGARATVELRGSARLRCRVRSALAENGVPCRDELVAPKLPPLPMPPLLRSEASLLANWRQIGRAHV